MRNFLIRYKRNLFAIFTSCIFAWSCTYLAIYIFRNYAFGLFIWLPMVLGAVTTIILGYKNEVPRSVMRWNAGITLGVFCLGLLIFAFEGIICIIMAAPLGISFTVIGYIIGFQIIKKGNRNGPPFLALLLLSAPVVMGFESVQKGEGHLRLIVTSLEINAPPETVWKNVVQFPELKPPSEFVFKTGIAYPVSATIDGYGLGAIRHCNFSTGSFVEPITKWDEPELLKFDVINQPEPLKELSIYNIHPNHLHGYWVSRQGQFKLTRLSNGHTLLEGTTWYLNKIDPDFYWSLWSDYIVHSIHLRVLHHIKNQCERET